MLISLLGTAHIQKALSSTTIVTTYSDIPDFSIQAAVCAENWTAANLLLDGGACTEVATDSVPSALNVTVGGRVAHEVALTGFATCPKDDARREEFVQALINAEPYLVEAEDVKGWTPLHYAAYLGLEKMAKMLLACMEIDVNRFTFDGDATAITYAVREGHEAVARLLLARADTKIRTACREPLMLEALLAGNEVIAELIIEREDYDVEEELPWPYLRAFPTAALLGQRNVMMLLLEKDANPRTTYSKGDAVHAAAAEGHYPIVRFLLDFEDSLHEDDGECECKTFQYHIDALEAAAENGHERIVELFMDWLYRPQGMTTIGQPLHMAAMNGHEQIVRLLLDRGAGVNAKGGKYGNALQAAAAGGFLPLVTLLLARGADVHQQGGEHDNALQAAATYGHLRIVDALIRAGAKVTSKRIGGIFGTALEAASTKGHTDVVRRLLDSKADVKATGSGVQHSPPLVGAAQAGHEPIVELLLNAGAAIDWAGQDQFALEMASCAGHENIVRRLLDAGTPVDCKGGTYEKACSRAAAHGYMNIVRLLDARPSIRRKKVTESQEEQQS